MHISKKIKMNFYHVLKIPKRISYEYLLGFDENLKNLTKNNLFN
jgi:hypothetical protein